MDSHPDKKSLLDFNNLGKDVYNQASDTSHIVRRSEEAYIIDPVVLCRKRTLEDINMNYGRVINQIYDLINKIKVMIENTQDVEGSSSGKCKLYLHKIFLC